MKHAESGWISNSAICRRYRTKNCVCMLLNGEKNSRLAPVVGSLLLVSSSGCFAPVFTVPSKRLLHKSCPTHTPTSSGITLLCLLVDVRFPIPYLIYPVAAVSHRTTVACWHHGFFFYRRSRAQRHAARNNLPMNAHSMFACACPS